MESIITQSFGFNLKVMKALGLYLPEKPTALRKVRNYVVYFLSTLPVPVLGSLYFLLEEDIDMERVADNAFLLAEVACCITKLLPFINNSEQIKGCIHHFESQIFAVYRDQHVKILDKCVRICRRNSMVFVVSMASGTVHWATKPMFGNTYRLPVDVWLPFDPTTGPQIYYPVYLILVTRVFYTALSCAVIDPLIGGLACLATGQLMVLKDNLHHLSEYASEETGKEDKAPLRFKIIYNKIKRCIKHHNAILEFIKKYEESFSWVVFSQFMGSVVVLCFCCLQLSLVQPFSLDFFVMVGYSNILLIEIYFYCYYGTTLYEESNTLTNAIYMGKWYEYDVKSRKALIILMERAKKPMIVTSGKILDLSLATFTMILRRSYSLLAVLRNYK